MYKYQNVSSVEQTIISSGDVSPRLVPANAFTWSDIAIENPNFKYIGEEDRPDQSAGIQSVDTAVQPGAVTEGELVNNQVSEGNE